MSRRHLRVIFLANGCVVTSAVHIKRWLCLHDVSCLLDLLWCRACVGRVASGSVDMSDVGDIVWLVLGTRPRISNRLSRQHGMLLLLRCRVALMSCAANPAADR